MPPHPTLPEWPGTAGTASISVAETQDPGSSGRRIISGEIRALTQQELGSALDGVLRRVTTVAALTEAVLEVEAVRWATPKVGSARALQELARDLWEAGFPVRFGPSWTPAPGADVCVGVGGANRDLADFLSAHPSWRVA
jgi:hypothetical protein